MITQISFNPTPSTKRSPQFSGSKPSSPESFKRMLIDYTTHGQDVLRRMYAAKTPEELEAALGEFNMGTVKGKALHDRLGDLVTAILNQSNPFGIDIGHVTHEIVKPLTEIRANTEFLLDRQITDFRNAKKLTVNGFKAVLTSFLSVLKVYAKLEGKTPGDFSGNLTPFAQDLLTSCRNRYPGLNIRVQKDDTQPSGRKFVLGKTRPRHRIKAKGWRHLKLFEHTTLHNPYEIYIVMRNFLTNAIKYSKNTGTIGMEFKTGWGVDGTGAFRRYLMATVSDSGIGIPSKDAQGAITGQRASNVGGIPGTAYGLPESLRIIQEHKGSVFVASPTKQIKGVSRGTEVQVFFPLNDNHPSGAPISQPKLPTAIGPNNPQTSHSPNGNVLDGAVPLSVESSSTFPTAGSQNTLVAFYPDKPTRAPKSKRHKVVTTSGKKRRLATTAVRQRTPRPRKAGQRSVALAK